MAGTKSIIIDLLNEYGKFTTLVTLFFVFYNRFKEEYMKMKIVFMGSSEFGIPALTELLKKHTVVGIVSTPPRPQGRGLKLVDSPISIFAEQQGLHPVIKPEKLKSDKFQEELLALQADLFVVVAFKILPKSIFSMPPWGTINIHASLLPKYRGPAPIQRAIQAGEKETGITIFRIDEGIDTGEILLKKSIPIGSKETTPELFQRLSVKGSEMILEAIDNMEEKSGKAMQQENDLSSKAPKLSKEEAHVDWSNSATVIFNKIRAFKPFPGTFCFLDEKRLGIDWALVINETATGMNGKICKIDQEYFDVQCNPGILRIARVKPEGRKVMNVHDFLLGNRLMEGKILE